MRGNPGKLVQSQFGKGIIRNTTRPIDGVFLVEMLDDNFKPVLKDNKPVTRCIPGKDLQLIGMVD